MDLYLDSLSNISSKESRITMYFYQWGGINFLHRSQYIVLRHIMAQFTHKSRALALEDTECFKSNYFQKILLV